MGIVDPAAGDWFPEQALELARLARPRLRRGPVMQGARSSASCITAAP
ncbi:MAG: hypothetical protein ACJ72B_03545 [Ornithinibacter sp.]